MKAIAAVMSWVDARVAEAAGMAMVVMLGCVTVDVLLRYTLNSPLSWSYDLVSMYLLPAIVFLPLAVVQKRRHHVNVDILYLKFSPRWQAVATMASLVASGAVVGVIATLAGQEAARSFAQNEVISGPIAWPAWIGNAVLAVGGLIFVARVLVDFCLLLAGHGLPPRSGEAGDPDARPELEL